MSGVVAAPEFDAGRLRAAEFPRLQPGYLNAASFTPLPERSRRAVEAVHELRGDPHRLNEADLVSHLEGARRAAAQLVGASPREIALAWNTSFGINLAAFSLPIPSGSTIVVSAREFPTNVYPWMAAPGAKLEIVPADRLGRPDEERLLERLDRGDVSVFALSSVQFATGYRADLERFGEFCRERGIFFVVDAIQAVGQIPTDVRKCHVDILATGGQKWLCAPFGTGFVYIRDELLEKIDPVMVGWTGMTASGDVASLTDYQWGWRPDAQRFEVATLPFQDFAGFTASVELLAEVGVDRIAAHTGALLEPLVRWLEGQEEVELVTPREVAHRSAILAFRVPAVDAVFGRLAAAGVVCGQREGAIRIAPHLYNDSEDIARVLQVLEDCRSDGTLAG